MNFFRLIAQSSLALSKESELELDYFSGSKIKDEELTNFQRSKYRGIFLQVLLFFYKVLINFKLFDKKKLKKPIFLFSETVNQFNTLKTISDALKEKGEDFYFFISKSLFKKNFDLENLRFMKFNFNVILVCFILFFYRALPLYLKLKKKNQKNKISIRFNQSCMSYVFIPYFIDLLKKIKPKIVIISNDHSVSNRSLRLSAEMLGIKTIYLQHASVSEFFPPLEFDYTLLDGKVSHQIYLHCYKNQAIENLRIKNNIKNCEIIFSGQKKIVTKKNKNRELSELNIGFAVGENDNFNYVQELLNYINNNKTKCIVRTHPAQDPLYIEKLKKYMEDKDWLSWSDPREHLISDYFAYINVIIAGESSIHLEAAIAGLPTFHYELSENLVQPDYYGYVKNGISMRLKKNFSLNKLKSSIQNKFNSSQRAQAIKNYSETYNTHWQNREGQLTCIIIDKILNNEPLDQFFNQEQQRIYKKVWRLKSLETDIFKEQRKE